MPKITFYNLHDDKKKALIAAAKKEFSRVPLYNASISNIIKSAGIPRGSFYQYFEDKEDAYFFLLSEYAKEKKLEFSTILINHHGDLFEGFMGFFALLIKEEEDFHFFKTAILNMTHKIESTFDRMISDREVNENFQLFLSLIDKSNLNISTEREFLSVLQIITTVTFRNLIQTFARDLPYQDAMENYRMEINLLKNGLSR